MCHGERPLLHRKSLLGITVNAKVNRIGDDGQPSGTSEAFRRPRDITTPPGSSRYRSIIGMANGWSWGGISACEQVYKLS